MNFTTKELEEFQSRGIAAEKVEAQIDAFKNGFPYLSISRAAVVGDGIMHLSSEELKHYTDMAGELMSSDKMRIVKFVPASGAATRMFKDYFEYVDGKEMPKAVGNAIENIEKFAFCDDLKSMGVDFSDSKALVSAIIGEQGLNYGKMPKALLKFHSYKEGGRTACEEHLVEGALYGVSGDGNVYIHFTLSPEHRAGFEELISKVKEAKERRYGITYQISYSEQKKSTDTIAVDMENNPFRLEDGSILFRPAGHGALLDNLNDIDADVIMVKTIDNVVPDTHKNDTIYYKKALSAVGLDLQQHIFAYLNAIEQDTVDLAQAKEFVESHFGYRFAKRELTKEKLFEVLNRPVRVCGMVKNEGEPGGGPFWVKNQDGSESLQIAESSQIAPEQKNLMQEATHFNPVDIICLPKNYKGEKFNLHNYVDPATGFISEKSFAGRALKAQELPGLWNGAMANWNTLFVEVPITTFAPVKVLTDLLRKEHQM